MADAGTTPTRLARDAGTSVPTIGNWLNDRVQVEQVKAALLLAISRALRIRPEWLLLGEGAKSAGTDVSQDGALASHPVQRSLLTSALQLVAGIVEEGGLPMPLEEQAELVTLVYDLLEEGMPEAKVLRFARAAA